VKKNLVIVYLAAAGDGISGGTRIHIECTKRWFKNKDFKSIAILASDDGYKVCLKNGVDKKCLMLVSTSFTRNINFWVDYIARIIKGTMLSFKHELKKNESYFVYAASDFWADFFPALILKLRYKKNVTLLASLYLFAPAPWAKDNPYKGRFVINGFLYWLTQIPVYLLIKSVADYVFVTSKPDVQKFITRRRGESKIIVAQGGVNITESERYFKSGKVIPARKRKYDACFVGRFHHQKGVSELIDIWNHVCKKLSTAKLAMVGTGSGPLENIVKDKIKKYHLEDNVELFGFLDGERKYAIFKNSKIVIHPATYDSGGMAAAEAMAWGLPGVSFDLKALKTYYPKGMIKTRPGDIRQFADNILRLLDNARLYKNMSEDARSLIIETWDWNKRARFILDKFI